jgi:hypothetical protein
MTGVATEAPLMVTCTLADGYHWSGQTNSVAAVPDGWKGLVTVHKASRPDILGRVRNRAVSHAARAAGAADKVALNPQPLPPAARPSVRSRVGEQVALNPQPLPPKTTGSAARTVAAAAASNTRRVDPDTLIPKTPIAQRSIGMTHLPEEILHPIVENPSGNGVATGIDFEIQPYVAPVVR